MHLAARGEARTRAGIACRHKLAVELDHVVRCGSEDEPVAVVERHLP